MKRKQGSNDRYEYLQQLINEFYTTRSIDAKKEVLANLANFSYNPVNYVFLRQLNIIKIFIDCLDDEDETIVEFAVSGLSNLAADPTNKEMINKSGVGKIVSLLDRANNEIVISALTVLIYLVSPQIMSVLTSPATTKTIAELSNSDDRRVRNLATIFMEDVSPK